MKKIQKGLLQRSSPFCYRKASGDGVHVPLHLDGVGAVQLDVQRTGVVQYLLRLAGTAQNVQPGDHPGGHGDDQLRHGAVVLLAESPHFASSSSACARRAGWKQGFVLRVLPSG